MAHDAARDDPRGCVSDKLEQGLQELAAFPGAEHGTEFDMRLRRGAHQDARLARNFALAACPCPRPTDLLLSL